MNGISLVHDIDYETNPKCKIEPADDRSKETITGRIFANGTEAEDWARRHGYTIVKDIWRDWPDEDK